MNVDRQLSSDHWLVACDDCSPSNSSVVSMIVITLHLWEPQNVVVDEVLLTFSQLASVCEVIRSFSHHHSPRFSFSICSFYDTWFSTRRSTFCFAPDFPLKLNENFTNSNDFLHLTDFWSQIKSLKLYKLINYTRNQQNRCLFWFQSWKLTVSLRTSREVRRSRVKSREKALLTTSSFLLYNC